jgi:hypothetical protein
LTFPPGMTDTVTSQNIDLSSWDDRYCDLTEYGPFLLEHPVYICTLVYHGINLLSVFLTCIGEVLSPNLIRVTYYFE